MLSAIRVTGTPLKEQRIAVLGAGSAGCGISNLLCRALIDAGLSEDEARARFYLVDRPGLLVEGMADITPAQQPFLQKRDAVASWVLKKPDQISLVDVVSNAAPTALIGVSGQTGAFTADVVEAMAARVERPVIFPLSNPTSRSEATPDDLLMWTRGKALVGTGSPFPPVTLNGQTYVIDQTNNSYIFPGVGLGVMACKARRVTDTMFMASAKALAELSPAASGKSQRLLPRVEDLRLVSMHVARAVALQAMKDGVADNLGPKDLEVRLKALIWEPVYHPYRKVTG